VVEAIIVISLGVGSVVLSESASCSSEVVPRYVVVIPLSGSKEI
jgi:hypothetical protein